MTRANLHPNPLSGHSEDYPDPESETADQVADFIRDEVCCPRIHGCELGGAPECPAERVRALGAPSPTTGADQ